MYKIDNHKLGALGPITMNIIIILIKSTDYFFRKCTIRFISSHMTVKYIESIKNNPKKIRVM